MIIHKRDEERIYKLLTSQAEYDLGCVKDERILKIYHQLSELQLHNWKYPFIDLFPASQILTHLNRTFLSPHLFSKKNVYPMVLRPLGKYWLPVPNYGVQFLREKKVDKIFDECYYNQWNHRLDLAQEDQTIPCKELYNYFSFIQRLCNEKDGSDCCLEWISVDKKTIYLFYYDYRPIVITIE